MISLSHLSIHLCVSIVHTAFAITLLLTLCSQDNTVVVADFGLARSVAVRNRGSVIDVDSPTSSKRRLFRRHRCKTIVGSPYWMAPEMIHGLAYDEKVDVFSFGMIICEVRAAWWHVDDSISRNIHFHRILGVPQDSPTAVQAWQPCPLWPVP